MPGLDEDLVIPNPDLSIRQGAIAPFRTEQWGKHLRDLVRVARPRAVTIDTPYSLLTAGAAAMACGTAKASYIGIRGFFRYLEKKSYKMHYRIFAARFRGYTTCPDCDGYRLRPAALYVQIGGDGHGRARSPHRRSLRADDGRRAGPTSTTSS